MKFQKREPFGNVDILFEKDSTVKVHTDEDIYKIIKKGQRKTKAKIIYDGPIEASKRKIKF